MAKGRLSSLLKEYDKSLLRHKGESGESIEILKTIVQAFVEWNDDKSAYNYQQKVCDAYEKVYGQANISTKRARLYCRELMIRSAPIKDRVRLCREYWQDAKNEYGENSYLVRILAPLYLACCYDANEIEELKIVCSEIVSIFCENEDEESRKLVALCSDFDVIIGEKSGDINQLESACRRAESLFGKDSIYGLRLKNEIGLIYRNNKEFNKAAEIHNDLFRLSQIKFGKYALDTIIFQKEYIIDLVSSRHLREALAEAKRLERAVKVCPDRNQCPDIYECFAHIYMSLEKGQLAEKYGRMSLAYNEGNLGSNNPVTLKSKHVLAMISLMFRPNDRAAFRSMLECMAEKEQWLYNIYLLSSDVGREKYFMIQNRGEYDTCFGVVLSKLVEPIENEDLLSLWEVVCNYKTLMGDCEFLHSAISKKENISKAIDVLKAAMQSEDKKIVVEAERCLLELSRLSDFPGYVNSVNVRDIQGTLQENEMLLDYYCVHFSDLEVYVAMVVTKHSLELVQLGPIGKTDELIDRVTSIVCREKTGGAFRDRHNEKQGYEYWIENLFASLSDCVIPQMSMPQKVIICPDGELYRLAFDLLIKDTEIVYVTNPKDIARGRNGACNGETPVKTVNVFADPAFSLAEEQTHHYGEEESQERSDELARLPGTHIEAAVIQRIYGGKVRQFARADANEQTFFCNCNADIIHIGTHAGSENGGVIYLSGANDAGEKDLPPAFGKGCITAGDIAGLNMDHTRLAVLSACQTGIGEYRDYLGVRGLRRAFQIAGVDSVIATLWNISDIATAVFMYVFYTEYSECGDCIAAMYHAKNYMKNAAVREVREQIYPVMSDILIKSGSIEAYKELRDMIQYGKDEERLFSSPYYWAAFSLYDSFRNIAV